MVNQSPTTTRIKNWPKFLVDNGILAEINRKIMHPLGLEIIADVAYDNRKQLAIVGIDSTDDDEGCLFSEDALEENMDQYNRFLERNKHRLNIRKEKLGFIVQEKKKAEEVK